MNVDSKIAKGTLSDLDKLVFNHKKMVLSTIYTNHINNGNSSVSLKEFYSKYLDK